MALWNSCNIDIPQTLKSCNNFFTRKFENRAPTTCRLCPILSWSTISFQLHSSGGGDRYRIVQFSAIFGNSQQFLEIHKLSDLDLGLSQHHISMHNTCRTTNMLNHVTVALSNTEIWPFEICVISTFREVWSHMIAFLEGNLKTGFQQAVDKIPYYHNQPSVLSSMPKQAEEIDLDLDLGSGWGHTGAHIWSRSTHTPN